jgi:hypothetical protein
MGLIGNLRGSSGTTGTTGATGATGAAGASGTQWYTEATAPTLADNATGHDGDLWLALDTGDLYKKVSGSWA